ncbi:phosphoglycerate mutase-like protein [Aspergillus steynii IBT 23096]|uniref:Phosphoglycerate mutase-like protein n=1 Tax=Aspergillus steynii IBT 23096 TaxID=1392250 RepID=A0A2I2GH11_9EURO|nr:phosphoglycerate mutase-like protein [Aspergillus steynii IBT 23096]PLB52166.1 phosphoglycerate mutase-like protein [Aspergillus steynii IBT 23096]
MRSSSQPSSLVLALLATPFAPFASAERVLGAYVFARHGDRTPKVLGSTQLTDLGYSQVYQTGSYYHDRYIDSDSASHIEGISSDLVKLSQIDTSAPSDNVLQNSAIGFLQGVYPPAGSSANQTLSNGTTVEAPLNGYQLIPLSLISQGTDSEDNTWLQDATGCENAKVSSNNYYSSTLYSDILSSSASFYKSLSSMLSGAFSDSEMSFKNAYTIFDYLNVASIHNTSNTPSASQLTRLFHLANIEQYNLAYNTTDTARAIAGSQLAGEMLAALNATITNKAEKKKLNIQFGSYGTFLSYFGLAQLPGVNVNFTGVPDYASSMAWELVTDAPGSSFPSESEISVRFVFHNGTITDGSSPSEYALYGESNATIPWSTFVEQTKKIAVSSDEEWCEVCGNSDSKCSSSGSGSGSDSGSGSVGASSKDDGGVSRPVAGVIGAMVTLAVILGLEALILAVGGFRIAKKQKNAGVEAPVEAVTENKKVDV